MNATRNAKLERGETTANGLLLSGLDGANPLAFLAALGVLRGLTKGAAEASVRMSWRQMGFGWRPQFDVPDLDPEGVVSTLSEYCRHSLKLLDNLFPEERDLGMTLDDFRRYGLAAIHKDADREAAVWIAAIGCDAILDDSRKEPTIQDTALRTMSGSGHQHFLLFGRNLLTEVSENPSLLSKALFCSWRYDDPVKNLTLRLDPVDDVRYALQWQNPSTDSSRKDSGSVLGANALAFLGMPMLPTAPCKGRLATTGFRGHRANNTFWTWPIWEKPVSADTVQALLQHEALQTGHPSADILKPIGIGAVFRSKRLTVGKYRNFSPARAVMT